MHHRRSAWPVTRLVSLLAVVSLGLMADASAQPPAPSTRDGLLDGVLIGAGAGFATGFLGFAAVNAEATDSGPIWSGENVGIYTSAGLVGAGIGAGLGALVDALIRDRPGRRSGRGAPPAVEVTPMVGPAARGAVVSIRY